MYNMPRWFAGNLPAYKVNYIVACIAGTLFAAGWWFLFDLLIVYANFMWWHKIYNWPGIVATIALIFMNCIPTGSFYSSYYYSGGFCSRRVALLCLFMGLIAAFGALIAALYILIADFALRDVEQWPGYAIFMQNFLIFLANMIMRFGRKEDLLY